MFDTKEIVIGGTEWQTAPFRFNKMFILGGGSGSSYIDVLLTGVSPLTLTNALGLNYVKAFGATEQRNLPSDYTQVEYLESTGTQYIMTDVYLSGDNYEFFIDYETSNITSKGLFGVQPGNALFVAFSGSLYNQPTSTTPTNRVRDDVFFTGRHALTVKTNDGTVEYKTDDGTVTSYSLGTTTAFDATLFGAKPIGLFGYWNGNIVQTERILSGKIYRFYIKKNGSLIFNGFPAKYGTAVGMYDTVSGTFFTNAGTGTFTAGADVAPTPDTPMDIISNNGVLKYGYQSVNMFDKNSALEDGEIWGPSGGTQPLAGYYGTNQIHVIGGHTYTRNGSHGSANYIKLSNGTWINQSDTSATITMPDNAVLWIFNNTTSTSRDIMMVVEGTSLPAEYVPYKGYGIYTDSTVETVNVHGKNLLAKPVVRSGTTLTNSDFFKIKAGTYTFKTDWTGDLSDLQFRYYLFIRDLNFNIFADNQITNASVGGYYNNTNGTWQYAANITSTSGLTFRFTLLSDAYICFGIGNWKSGFGLEDFTNHQIELGSTATAYEPYYDGGTATAEMLLKVGNYKDEQSILDGIITRNIGVKVLDGTESLKEMGGTRSWGYCYYLDSQLQNAMSAINVNSYTTHFKAVSRCWDTATGPCFSFHQSGVSTWTGKPFFVVEQDTAEKFNQWLADQYNAGTPVIIVYPLATPTTETVSGQSLTASGNCTVTATGSLDNLELEISYKQSN